MKTTDNTMVRFLSTCENVHFIASLAAASATQNPTEKIVKFVLSKVGEEVEDLVSILDDAEDTKPRWLPFDVLDRTRQTLDSIRLLICLAKKIHHVSMLVFEWLAMEITALIDSIISDIPDEVMEAAL